MTFIRHVELDIEWFISPCIYLFKTSASFSMGWAAFMCMSPNVKEEGAMKEDTGTQDTPYTEVSVCLILHKLWTLVCKETFSNDKTIDASWRLDGVTCYCLASSWSLCSLTSFLMVLHCAGHPCRAAGAVCGLSVEIRAIRAHRWHQQTCHCCLRKKEGL